MNLDKIKTPYYIFYADDFINNYHELETSMKSVYENYKIAYSFKTNYTPAVCNLIENCVSLSTYA